MIPECWQIWAKFLTPTFETPSAVWNYPGKIPFLKITILNFWNLVPTFLIIYDQTGWLLLYQKSQNNPPNDWPILSFITCSANAPSTPPSPASVPSPTDALHLISPLLLTLPLLLLLPLLQLSSFSCFTPLSSLPFLPPWHWRTRCSLHIIFFSESLFLSWEPFSLLDFYLFSHLYSWQKLPPFVNRICPLQIFFWNKLGTNASLYRDSLHICTSAPIFLDMNCFRWKIFEDNIFIGPMWTWGPIYGSWFCRFCRLNWCDSGWWRYQLNSIHGGAAWWPN